MAPTRLVMNQAGVSAILDAASRLVAERAKAIADACNADSSWGGYESEVETGADGTAVARVWAIDESSNESRNQRLLRNLDAQ